MIESFMKATAEKTPMATEVSDDMSGDVIGSPVYPELVEGLTESHTRS